MEIFVRFCVWIGISRNNEPQAQNVNSSTYLTEMIEKAVFGSIFPIEPFFSNPEKVSKSLKPSPTISIQSLKTTLNQSKINFKHKKSKNTNIKRDYEKCSMKIPDRDTFEEDSFNKKSQNSSKNKIDYDEITLNSIQSCCIKCGSQKDVVAFLCDHNCCKMCLSIYCCNEILSYCYSVNNSIDVGIKFNFHCLHCKKVISLPTRMVINYYLENIRNEQDEQIKPYLRYILENYIPFFDGIMMESSK